MPQTVVFEAFMVDKKYIKEVFPSLSFPRRFLIDSQRIGHQFLQIRHA